MGFSEWRERRRVKHNLKAQGILVSGSTNVITSRLYNNQTSCLPPLSQTPNITPMTSTCPSQVAVSSISQIKPDTNRSSIPEIIYVREALRKILLRLEDTERKGIEDLNEWQNLMDNARVQAHDSCKNKNEIEKRKGALETALLHFANNLNNPQQPLKIQYVNEVNRCLNQVFNTALCLGLEAANHTELNAQDRNDLLFNNIYRTTVLALSTGLEALHDVATAIRTYKKRLTEQGLHKAEAVISVVPGMLNLHPIDPEGMRDSVIPTTDADPAHQMRNHSLQKSVRCKAQFDPANPSTSSPSEVIITNPARQSADQHLS